MAEEQERKNQVIFMSYRKALLLYMYQTHLGNLLRSNPSRLSHNAPVSTLTGPALEGSSMMTRRFISGYWIFGTEMDLDISGRVFDLGVAEADLHSLCCMSTPVGKNIWLT